MSLKDGVLYRGYMGLSDGLSNMSKQDWGVVIALALSGYLMWTYPWDSEDEDDDDTPDQPAY